MSVSEIIIKILGLILAVVGFFLLLAAIGIHVAGIGIDPIWLEVLMGVIFLGMGIVIVRGGTIGI